MQQDKRFRVTIIDEFNTSQICSRCFGGHEHSPHFPPTAPTTPAASQDSASQSTGDDAGATKKLSSVVGTYVVEENFREGRRHGKRRTSLATIKDEVKLRWTSLQLWEWHIDGDSSTLAEVAKHRKQLRADNVEPQPWSKHKRNLGEPIAGTVSVDSHGRKSAEFFVNGELLCRRTLHQRADLHGCKVCEHCTRNGNKSLHHNRDVNAAKNILFIYEFLADQQEVEKSRRRRPVPFCSSSSSSSSASEAQGEGGGGL